MTTIHEMPATTSEDGRLSADAATALSSASPIEPASGLDQRLQSHGATGMTFEEKVAAAVATLNPQAFEPFIKRASDDFYESLLETVQNYLRENAEWNIRGEIDNARACAKHYEDALDEISDLLGVSRYSQEARVGRISVLIERAKVSGQ
jgi:hypothetical protein